MTAFSLVVKTAVFSRFDSARAFSSWLGLIPSEHLSGEKVYRGSVFILKNGKKMNPKKGSKVSMVGDEGFEPPTLCL